MQILAISGSLRASSTKTRHVRAIARLASPDMEITLYEGLADLPHFTLISMGQPSCVGSLSAQLIQAADGVLICTPEYAFGVPERSRMHSLDRVLASSAQTSSHHQRISALPGGDKAHASLLLTTD